MVSRRSLLAALPATALLSSANHTSASELPADRVARLMRELSEALSDYVDGSFRAVVDPSNVPGGTFMLQCVDLASPPDGVMQMTLNGRPLVIDTNDIPEVFQVQDEGAPHFKTWVSWPDKAARYLIIGRHGTLEVSTLSPTSTTWLPHDPKRTGSVEWTEPGAVPMTCRQIVRIVGKVLDQ